VSQPTRSSNQPSQSQPPPHVAPTKRHTVLLPQSNQGHLNISRSSISFHHPQLLPEHRSILQLDRMQHWAAVDHTHTATSLHAQQTSGRKALGRRRIMVMMMKPNSKTESFQKLMGGQTFPLGFPRCSATNANLNSTTTTTIVTPCGALLASEADPTSCPLTNNIGHRQTMMIDKNCGCSALSTALG